MALSVASGSLNVTTAAAGNTVVVSGQGFQPKAVILIWNGRTDTTDANGRSNQMAGIGAFTATTERAYTTCLSQDTPTSMVTNMMKGNAACIGVTTTADAIDGLMDVQSLDSGGFTLVIDDAFTASFRVHWIMLGGDDLTNAVVSSFTKQDGTGDQDITSLSFQPDFVLVFGNRQTTNNNTVLIDANLNIGIAAAAGQGVLLVGSNDASANAQTLGYCTDAEFIAAFDTGVTATTVRGTFSQFLSNGFRVNWAENVAGGYIFNFLALKGMGVKVGSGLTQTDTSTTVSTGSLGFTPRGGLVFSHTRAEDAADTPSDDLEISMGVFSSTSARGAMGAVDNDAAGTAVVSTAVEHDEVYVNMLDTDGTIQGLMDVNSVGSDDVTWIMDDADPAQAIFLYAVFGDTPVATGHPTMARWQGVPHLALPTARLGHARR